MRTVAIVIPAYNPDDKLIKLLKQLREQSLEPLIVIDDGSASKCREVFADAAAYATVLRHAVNQGKGRALKTVFHYILNERPEIDGIVTADADGQHCVPDIAACRDALIANPDALVMGCRAFGESTPLHNRLGNGLTRVSTRLICDIRVSDTQTGLRAFSRERAAQFLAVKGERYEYEMRMLVSCKDLNISICEVPIQTIYLDDNRSSHFSVLRDSFLVYAVLLKFLFSSVVCFLLDWVLFVCLLEPLTKLFPGDTPTMLGMLPGVLAATAAARLASTLANYTINKNKVFKSGTSRGSMARYYALAVVLLVASAFVVSVLTTALGGAGAQWIKLPVDALLALFSFIVQKNWVFKKTHAA